MYSYASVARALSQMGIHFGALVGAASQWSHVNTNRLHAGQ
jgi:hypothetical protein